MTSVAQKVVCYWLFIGGWLGSVAIILFMAWYVHFMAGLLVTAIALFGLAVAARSVMKDLEREERQGKKP